MIRAMRPSSIAAAIALVSGCGSDRPDPSVADGRRVLAVYDEAMAIRGAARADAVRRLAALRVVDPGAVRARDVCSLMLESLAAATELQQRLEPMADRLDDYVRRDAAVPEDERARVLQLYALANRSADATAASIEPCTSAMDELRTRTLGRRERR